MLCLGWRRVLLLVIVALLGGSPEPASAADVPTADMQHARARFQVGVALYRSGAFSEAYQAFSEAYQLSKLPDMLYNMAHAAEKSGRTDAAIRHLQAYLATPSIPDRAQAQAYLQELQQHQPAAAASPPPDTVARTPAATITPAPAPTPAPPLPAPTTTAPPPPRSRALAIAKWTTAALGLLGIIAGASLLAVDGRPGCDAAPRQCQYLLSTRDAGISLLSLGGASAAAAGVLFFIDYRRGHGDSRVAALGIGGRF